MKIHDQVEKSSHYSLPHAVKSAIIESQRYEETGDSPPQGGRIFAVEEDEIPMAEPKKCAHSGWIPPKVRPPLRHQRAQ